MLYKTGFVSISPTVAKWQATQKCVTDRHKIFPLTAIAPILNRGWGQQFNSIFQMAADRKEQIMLLLPVFLMKKKLTRFCFLFSHKMQIFALMCR